MVTSAIHQISYTQDVDGIQGSFILSLDDTREISQTKLKVVLQGHSGSPTRAYRYMEAHKYVTAVTKKPAKWAPQTLNIFYTTEKALSENQVTLKADCIIPKEDNEPIQLN